MAAKANIAAQDDDPASEFDIGPDAEVIVPKVNLRRKAKERRSRPGDIDPVAAAEAAMEEMKTSFSVWMQNETEKLLSVWKSCDSADFSEEGRLNLYRSSHDIKGQAATLGFPPAGQVAASLCHLLDAVKPTAKIPRELVRQHALAIRAIAHESTQDQPNAIAEKLAQRLKTVTDEYIASLG